MDAYHMTKEHKMKELSFSDLVSVDPVDIVSVTQWTFILPTDELLSYQQINSAIDSRQDDASTDVSEISDDEYDGDVNEVHSRLEHSRYDHRVIRDFSNSSDTEDDASTDESEISDDEYDGDKNEFHNRYDHRVIRDFPDSSDE